MPYPTRASELVEQVRAHYLAGAETLNVISTLFGLAPGEIFALARQHGWQRRSSLPDQTPAERAAAMRAAEAQREAALYGDAAGDVRQLRQRGFFVVREGAGYRVGNQVVTVAGLRAKAARERRLAKAASMPKFRHPFEHHTAG